MRARGSRFTSGGKMNFSAQVLSTYLFLSLIVSSIGRADTDDPRYDKRASRPNIDFTVPVAENEIKIMEYNVNNLFDAVHDDGKSDWEFLPINHPLKKNCENEGSYKKQCYETNWTEERLQLKLRQIHKVVAAQGVLPDMLALEEVENSNVVGMLAKELGYDHFIVTNSPDVRGVDVALLFNESKVSYLNHSEKEVVAKGLKTRNLLVVNFTVKKTKEVLGVFVNHWPSQGKNSNSRMEVAQALKSFVNAQAKNSDSYHAILTGDFNTIDADLPHPFQEVILNSSWKENFFDVQNLFDGMKLREGLRMPQGSYFYFGDGRWNRLDRFFVNRHLVNKIGLELVPESFRIVAPEFMTKAFEFYSQDQHAFASVIFGVPRGYNHNAASEAATGYSDHFPIVVKLRFN